MTHAEKQLLTRTSPMVIEHITTLLQPLPELSPGVHTLQVKSNTKSTREEQLFWRYHDHFSMEFVKALANFLPNGYMFLSYDHFKNELKIEVI